MRNFGTLGASFLVVATATTFADARADSVSDFYKNHRLKIVVGFAPGGGFDRGGRVVQRHIGKYVPG